MYCPRCGHQTTSDELRFCSYCGFKLGVVKAALSEGEEVPLSVLAATQTALPEPRQRDMNVGVCLMFVASMLASFMTNWPGLGLSRVTGAAILTILYLAILVLSGQITKGIHKLLSWEDADLASSQRGVCFGATLMFISTVIVAIGSLLVFGRMRTTPFFAGLGIAFAFCLLLSQHLMRVLRYLVQGESRVALPRDTSNQPKQLASVVDVQGLPAGMSVPASLFGTQKVQTAEIVAPSSITEHTTNLFENK